MIKLVAQCYDLIYLCYSPNKPVLFAYKFETRTEFNSRAMELLVIALQLSSGKIKDKTQALDSINHLIRLRTPIGAKGYRLLIDALAKFISSETQLHARTPQNAAVETRLATGITVLRDFLATATRGGVVLKLKGYLSVVDIIIHNYWIHNEDGTTMTHPAYQDFLLMLDTVVKTRYFSDHVLTKEWYRVFQFLLATMSDQGVDEHMYTQQITYAMTVLAHLVGDPVSSTPLKLYQHFLELERVPAVDMGPRIKVNQLRIINKVIVVTPGFDQGYVSRMVARGLFLLMAPLPAMDAIHVQVVTFISNPITVKFWPKSFTLTQMTVVIVNLLRAVEAFPRLRWKPEHNHNLEQYTFMMGLGRLVSEYFTRKHHQNQENTITGFGGGLLTTSEAPASKRPRREPLDRHLEVALSALGFCFRLMDIDKVMSLQLLAAISTSDVVLGYLAIPEITYWVLQVISHQLHRAATSNRAGVMRQVLPYIKNAEPVGSMACLVFNEAVALGNVPTDPLEISAVEHQLNTVINFADTNGPVVILKLLLEFWGYLSLMSVKLGIQLPSDFSHRVLRWFAGKWPQFKPCEAGGGDISGALRGLIGLMSVEGCEYKLPKAELVSECQQYWKQYLDLAMFIGGKQQREANVIKPPKTDIPLVTHEIVDTLHKTRSSPALALLVEYVLLLLGEPPPPSRVSEVPPYDAIVIFNHNSQFLADDVKRDLGLWIDWRAALTPTTESHEETLEFDNFMDVDVKGEYDTVVFPTWAAAEVCNSTETSIVRFLKELDPEKIVTAFGLMAIETLVWALPALVDAVALYPQLLGPVISYFGSTMLSNASIRSSEVVVVAATKLLVAAATNEVDESVAADCTDIERWLLELVKAEGVVTEQLLVSVVEWLCHSPEYLTTLADVVSTLLINGLVATAPALVKTLSQLPSASQRTLTNAALTAASVAPPMASVYYLALLSRDLFVAMYAGVVSIVETAISTPESMEACAAGLGVIARHYSMTLVTELFEILKVELFALWWTRIGTFADFPWRLFHQYEDNVKYGREMVAVALALRPPEPVDLDAELATLAGSRKLIMAAIPLAFSLGYTEHGVDNIIGLLQKRANIDGDILADGLMVIILQILRNVDVSDEKKVALAFGYSDDGDVIVGDSLMLQLTPRNAKAILDQLNQNYIPEDEHYGKKSGFLRHKWVYFWLRHMSADAVATMMDDQRLILVRRLKMTMLICQGAISLYLAELLVETVIKLMPFDNTRDHLWEIFMVVGVDKLRNSELMVGLVNAIVCLPHFPPSILPIILTLANKVSPEIRGVVQSGINYLKNGQINLSILEVDDYLSCSAPTPAGLALIAQLEPPIAHVANPKVAQFMQSYKHEWPPKLLQWRRQYLSRYYLQGGVPEVTDIAEAGFDSIHKTLDGVLNAISGKDLVQKYTLTDWGYVEATLAALMAQHGPQEFIDVLHNFASRSNGLFGRYLQELPIQGFLMLMAKPTTPLKLVSQVKLGKPSWMLDLMIAMLTALEEKSVVAMILAHLMVAVPKIVTGTLPLVLVYYLYRLRRRSLPEITAFFKQLGSAQSLPDTDQQMVVELVVALRSVAKLGDEGSYCSKVLEQIDLIKVAEYSANVGRPKFAMMLVEDCAEEKSPLWSTLNRVYRLLPDPDLLSGLPHQPTLTHAIAEINRNGSNQTKSCFGQANIAADTFLGKPIKIRDDPNWCWRLNQWTVSPQRRPKTVDSLIYAVLKQVHDRGQFSLEWGLELALSPQAMAAVVAIDDVINHRVVDDPWLDDGDAGIAELVINSRQVAYQILGNSMGVVQELLRLAKLSPDSSITATASFIVDGISKHSPKFEPVARYMAAHLVWSQGQTDAGVAILESLVGSDIEVDNKWLDIPSGAIAATLTEWKALLRQAHPRTLMNEYVDPHTLALAKANGRWSTHIASAFRQFADFCDTQAKSPQSTEEIARLDKRRQLRQFEFEAWAKSKRSDSTSTSRQYEHAHQQWQQAEMALAEANMGRAQFASKAVEFYLLAMSIEPDDQTTDKFIAAWLDSAGDEALNVKLAKLLIKLPSAQLILWTNQLMLRLDDSKIAFQKVLWKVLHQMVARHPYHTVYQLISLKHDDGTRVDPKNKVAMAMAGKRAAARHLWNKVMTTSHGEILMEIDKFCNEIYTLAKLKTKAKELDIFQLPETASWISTLPHIPPPTLLIPIRQLEDYSDLPIMVLVDTKAKLAPLGLSRPKIICFYLANGSHHKLLTKYGHDDLRQDLIMEQVFGKVNQMFDRDSKCRQRHLRVRTYNVVPIGPNLGMIEFVDHASGLIEVLRPYHRRQTMSADEARQLMKDVQKRLQNTRVETFRQIKQHIKPVMRLWFRDTFIRPDEWYASRTAWARGVAALSMVGHILGIGDRHCNNVMVDTITAEPLHIDLGVAFDQGKRLTIPETVPFRLTGDMVDGFGVTGVDGMFTMCCQHSLRVLRDHANHILAILDVLRWDPLYLWSISAVKLFQLQQDVTERGELENDGSEAAKAIVTVSDKLRGMPGNLSVEANVRELIHDATSDMNLAMIYQGWTPFF